MKIIHPESPSDWQNYYALRYEVLREPWNQPLGTEILDDEQSAIHAMVVEKDNALAVARLHEASKGIGQVRCVAVATDQQGKGLGKMLMRHLEEEAYKKGMKEIILEARENAVPFYEKIGYSIVKKSYLLFGEIQHYTMRKEIL
ncbi:MAG: hypothetical protein RJA76_253 [Bacteroidota bacterium]|jgi:N-acetylglutamate synthase-like GNAT family acetyltransferase